MEGWSLNTTEYTNQTNYSRFSDLLGSNSCRICTQPALAVWCVTAAVYMRGLENTGVVPVVLFWEQEMGKKSSQVTWKSGTVCATEDVKKLWMRSQCFWPEEWQQGILQMVVVNLCVTTGFLPRPLLSSILGPICVYTRTISLEPLLDGHGDF